MSISGDQMELREEEIAAHYYASVAMLDWFSQTPRITWQRKFIASESGRVASYR